MSLGMIVFLAVVMAIAWRRYQRHATQAAERSHAAMLELLTVSEVVADQSHGENSGQNRGEGAQDAEITSDSDLLHELNR
jgi:predicted negative regulator of RcsB-dependent stress response